MNNNGKKTLYSILAVLLLALLLMLAIGLTSCVSAGEIDAALEGIEMMEEVQRENAAKRENARAEIMTCLENEIASAEHLVQVLAIAAGQDEAFMPHVQEAQRHVTAMRKISDLVLRETEMSMDALNEQSGILQQIVTYLQQLRAEANVGDIVTGFVGGLAGVPQSDSDGLPQPGGGGSFPWLPVGTLLTGTALAYGGYRKVKTLAKGAKAGFKTLQYGAEKFQAGATATLSGLQHFGNNVLQRMPQFRRESDKLVIETPSSHPPMYPPPMEDKNNAST